MAMVTVIIILTIVVFVIMTIAVQLDPALMHTKQGVTYTLQTPL